MDICTGGEIEPILAKLIGFPSISARSNLDIAGYIENFLVGIGAECLRFPSPDGSKTNLFATIGPNVPGGVVLSGHMDVVPTEGQKWSSDPFTLVERGGMLFGRGTTDMKGFLATSLVIAPAAAAAHLRRPLHFAFSYDEEVGCTGVGPMIDHIVRNVPDVMGVIVGEPTAMNPVNAHKGAYDWRTVVSGLAAHSSMPHLGAHAIFAGADLIGFIDRLQQQFRSAAVGSSPFAIPYPTLSVGIAGGGTAGNIIPDTFSFEWEARTTEAGQAEDIIRSFSAYAEENVMPALRTTAPDASIVSSQLFGVPPLTPDRDSNLERLVVTLCEANSVGAVSYCTEGGLFQQAGISTLLCGPGSIEQAHQPNEFIAPEQLEACRTLLLRIVDTLTS